MSSFTESAESVYFGMMGNPRRDLNARMLRLMRWMPMIGSLQVLVSFSAFLAVDTLPQLGIAAGLAGVTVIMASVGVAGAVRLQRLMMLLHFVYTFCVLMSCASGVTALVYYGYGASISILLLLVAAGAQIPALYVVRQLAAYADELGSMPDKTSQVDDATPLLAPFPTLLYPIVQVPGVTEAHIASQSYGAMNATTLMTPADMQVGAYTPAMRQQNAAYAEFLARVSLQPTCGPSSPQVYAWNGAHMVPIYAGYPNQQAGAFFVPAEAEDASAGRIN